MSEEPNFDQISSLAPSPPNLNLTTTIYTGEAITKEIKSRTEAPVKFQEVTRSGSDGRAKRGLRKIQQKHSIHVYLLKMKGI